MGMARSTKKEIAAVLNSDSDVQEAAGKDLAEIIQELDKNGDGEIDFQEFMAMMRGTVDNNASN